jgi:hypothetical protein
MATSNMGLTQPTPTTATGPGWATSLNTNSSLIDAHDHSVGKGVPIGTAGINIQADFNVNGNRLSTPKSVVFQDQSVSLASTDARAVYCLNGNLFFVNGSTDVQITNGTALAGTPGSITGLVSPASVVFTGQNFSFFYASSTFADVSCRNVNLYQGANAMKLTYGGTSSYTCTFPGAVPAQSALVVMSTSGALSNGTSPTIGSDATGLVTYNSRIGIGSTSGVEPTVADSGYLGTSAKPLGYTYIGSVESVPKVIDGTPYALTDVPTFKTSRVTGPKLSVSMHTPDALGTEFNFTSTTDTAGTDPVVFFLARIRTANWSSNPVVNRKTFAWYNKTTEQMSLSADGTLNTRNVSAQAVTVDSLSTVGTVSCGAVVCSGYVGAGGVTATGPISTTSYATVTGSLSSASLSTGGIVASSLSTSGAITASGQIQAPNVYALGGVYTDNAYFKQKSLTANTGGFNWFTTPHGLDWTKIVSVTAFYYISASSEWNECTQLTFNSSNVGGTAGLTGVNVRILVTYTA